MNSSGSSEGPLRLGVHGDLQEIYVSCPACARPTWMEPGQIMCALCQRTVQAARARDRRRALRRRRRVEAFAALGVPVLLGLFYGLSFGGAYIAAGAPVTGTVIFWVGVLCLLLGAVLDMVRP